MKGIIRVLSALFIPLLSQNNNQISPAASLVGNLWMSSVSFGNEDLKYMRPLTQNPCPAQNQTAFQIFVSQICGDAQTSGILFVLEGMGLRELECCGRGNPELVTIVKEDLEQYRWARKNVYFNGLQDKTKVIWSKMGREDSIRRVPQFQQKYGILHFEPTVEIWGFVEHLWKQKCKGRCYIALQIQNQQNFDEFFDQQGWQKLKDGKIALIIKIKEPWTLKSDALANLINGKVLALRKLQLKGNIKIQTKTVDIVQQIESGAFILEAF